MSDTTPPQDEPQPRWGVSPDVLKLGWISFFDRPELRDGIFGVCDFFS
jgi:hypothetical protein